MFQVLFSQVLLLLMPLGDVAFPGAAKTFSGFLPGGYNFSFYTEVPTRCWGLVCEAPAGGVQHLSSGPSASRDLLSEDASSLPPGGDWLVRSSALSCESRLQTPDTNPPLTAWFAIGSSPAAPRLFIRVGSSVERRLLTWTPSGCPCFPSHGQTAKRLASPWTRKTFSYFSFESHHFVFYT